MNTLDLTPVFRTAIGFDRMAKLVDTLVANGDTAQPGWPPYNIEKHGDDSYRITMAVAGFSEQQLDVTVHDQMLIVRGSQSNSEENGVTYLHRGIAGRSFERRFQLADFIRVSGAQMENGLLHVELQREIPEAMKPRKIAISTGDDATTVESGSKKPKIVSSGAA